MKTSLYLLSLVSLSLTALSARAASPTEETEPVRMPVYVIEAPRQTPAEKEIQRCLDAMRAAAAKPLAIKIPLPLSLPEAKKATVQSESKSSQPTPTGVIVAGL